MDIVVPENSQFQWSIIGSDMPSALGLVIIYFEFLKRARLGRKYSKDMFSIKFRNKGWERTIWSWNFMSYEISCLLRFHDIWDFMSIEITCHLTFLVIWDSMSLRFHIIWDFLSFDISCHFTFRVNPISTGGGQICPHHHVFAYTRVCMRIHVLIFCDFSSFWVCKRVQQVWPQKNLPFSQEPKKLVQFAQLS